MEAIRIMKTAIGDRGDAIRVDTFQDIRIHIGSLERTIRRLKAVVIVLSGVTSLALWIGLAGMFG